MTLYRNIPPLLFGTLAISSFIGVLALWQALTHVANPILLPSPYRVLQDTALLFQKYNFATDILASIYRVTAGYALAVGVAIPLGILAGSVSHFRAAIEPINDFLRYLPVASFVPLTIIWFGIDDLQKFIIIFLGTVFQLIPMVADSVNRVPRHLVDLGYTMGLRSSQIVTRIVIPWSAPEIYDHMRICLGWAWSYLIVAEVVGSQTGIGHVIHVSQNFIQPGRVISAIVIIGILGLFFDLAFRLSKNRFFPWASQK